MNNKPLSDVLRPENIDEIFGQDHLTKNDGFIKKCLEQKTLFSIIFYGPSGVGKTSLALIIAKELNQHYRLLNASTSNKKDLEIIIEEAKMYGHLIVIIDEIHRLNKEKQDFLLSYIEKGLITIIGATTINPFISINPAIRSRCHILEMKSLNIQDIIEVLKFALKSDKGLNNRYIASDDVLYAIAQKSFGDVRFAINSLQVCAMTSNDNIINIDNVKRNLNISNHMMDKDADVHYNLLSALQKSIRGSDVDSALIYLAKLCVAGDMDSIERRLLVTAYEDIGLANPAAVDRTINAIESAKKVGFPEARIPLSFSVIDLSLSPKSKSSCISIDKAIEIVNNINIEIPEYLKLKSISLTQEEMYPYDENDLWDKIEYMPIEIKEKEIYSYNLESGNYEKALIENYKKYIQNNRSRNVKNLRKTMKK